MVKDYDSQIIFHIISTITQDDIQSVQERVRLRVLKSFKRSGLLEEHDMENMKIWNGGGGYGVLTSHSLPSWDNYDKDMSVDDNGMSIPESEFEFNQCVSFCPLTHFSEYFIRFSPDKSTKRENFLTYRLKSFIVFPILLGKNGYNLNYIQV